jgi:hypothetical protein
MERVRLGLIGLGLMGTPHARTLKKVTECNLVAASDVDEKQRAVTEELGIKFYRRYEEMIEKESLHGVISLLRTISIHPSALFAPSKGCIFLSRSLLLRASPRQNALLKQQNRIRFVYWWDIKEGLAVSLKRPEKL